MNKRTFLFNPKKRRKILIMGVLVAVLGGAMLYVSLQSGGIKTGYVLVFASVTVGGGSMALAQLLRMTSREQTGLELDADGLYFKGTILGKTVGKIKWRDIAAIQTGTVHGSNQLFVKLAVPGQYAAKIANRQVRKILSAQGLPLNADELDIDFHEMETCIMQYYHQYH
ncbi:hypothetical protein GCM10011386_29200 [Parapedobacter defluvii]|uniref:Uncharacterized protein n=1 Tax=Parapedobacter defluvii TaxID=2045106 RepID=A0ABQ1M5T3_9SPHI|nr:STM3941 family protein [Parapedobacter defluvii]RQP20087.1 MAG: hypothetical protein EAS52_00320 [Parapedobacter sp.]GGC35222.1 hypothetical protein GCM10011386_29200 [Parapedobacter defluvii]